MCIFTHLQAATYNVVTSRAVAEDNARAAPVFISGAMGWFSECINGFFAPSRENGPDGRVTYMKCGDNSICIEHRGGCWQIKGVSYRFQDEFISCGCSLQACGSRKWYVFNHKLVFVQQTIKIETGPDVERKVSSQPQATTLCTFTPHLMRFVFHQAAEHTAAVALSIAEDNARAVPVLISGATGFFKKYMNGLFTPSSERSLDGRVVYKKCDNTHMIIEHHQGQWAIKLLEDKGLSAMHGCVVGGCALESCVGRVWFVACGSDSGKWEEQPEVAISFGADVELQVSAMACALQRHPSLIPTSLRVLFCAGCSLRRTSCACHGAIQRSSCPRSPQWRHRNLF
jgi:hypothetical protein